VPGARWDVEAVAGPEHSGLSLPLHHGFAVEDIEKLLRFEVMVAHFGGPGRHRLFDHA